MGGGLNEILPEPISEANERAVLELVRKKATSPARIAVRVLRAMERRFGPEARQVVRDMVENMAFPPRPDPGDPQADLHEFCDRLERDCIGSHRLRRVIDEADRIGYEITGCLWADIFRELGEPELGLLYCAGDEPAVKSYNPALGFQRTKVLMNGDDICDHVFFAEDRDTSEQA